MLNNACHYSVLSFNIIVIQTTEGRKNLENMNLSINPRELKKGEKEPHTNESSFLSPPVLLKI